MNVGYVKKLIHFRRKYSDWLLTLAEPVRMVIEKVPASVALWPEFVAHNVAAQHKAYELACVPPSLRRPQYDVAREVVRVRDEAVCECIYIPVVQTQM